MLVPGSFTAILIFISRLVLESYWPKGSIKRKLQIQCLVSTLRLISPSVYSLFSKLNGANFVQNMPPPFLVRHPHE